jgi:hypothetical protein
MGVTSHFFVPERRIETYNPLLYYDFSKAGPAGTEVRTYANSGSGGAAYNLTSDTYYNGLLPQSAVDAEHWHVAFGGAGLITDTDLPATFTEGHDRTLGILYKVDQPWAQNILGYGGSQYGAMFDILHLPTVILTPHMFGPQVDGPAYEVNQWMLLELVVKQIAGSLAVITVYLNGQGVAETTTNFGTLASPLAIGRGIYGSYNGTGKRYIKAVYLDDKALSAEDRLLLRQKMQAG